MRRICSRPLTSGAPTLTWRSKRPGREQRRVEDVRPVRRRNHDDAVVRREAVHFDQQLVQRLLALLVAERLPPRLRPTASSSSMKTMHDG